MRYFSYNMMYNKISKIEKILFFGKKIAQVWAVTLKCNIRYILHQIQQNRYDETEYKIASLELVQCFIFNWVYTLH